MLLYTSADLIIREISREISHDKKVASRKANLQKSDFKIKMVQGK